MISDEKVYRCYICDKSNETIRLLPCLHYFCSLCLANYLAKYYLDYEQITKKINYCTKNDNKNNINLSVEDAITNNLDLISINETKISESNDCQDAIYEDIDLYVIPTELDRIPVQSHKMKNIYSKLNTINKETWQLSNFPKKIIHSLFADRPSQKIESIYDDLYGIPEYQDKDIFSKIKNENNFFKRGTVKSATSISKDLKKIKLQPPKLIRRPKFSEHISDPIQSSKSDYSIISDTPSLNEIKYELDDSISFEKEESIYLTPRIKSQIQDNNQQQCDKKSKLEFPCPKCQEQHKISADCDGINIFPILFNPISCVDQNNNQVCDFNLCINKSISNTFVCLTCQSTVCSICIDNFHSNHFYVSTQKILNWENSEKSKLINDVNIQIDNRIKNQQLLENKINKLENRKIKSINKIKKYRNYLIESINQETQLLISEIDDAYDHTKTNIKNIIKEIDEQINMFKYTLDFSNLTINNLKINSLCNKLIIDRILYLRYKDFNLDYNKRLSIKLNAMNFNAEDIRVLFGLTIKEKLLTERTKCEPEIQRPLIINSFNVRHKDAIFEFEPRIIVMPNNDDILIADNKNHKIQIFNSKGHYKKDLIMPEDKNLSEPCCIAFSQKFNELYVTDQANSDLKIFSLDKGIYKKSIKDGISNPWGVVVNSLGYIIISDLTLKKLLIFDRIQGNCLHSISSTINNNIYNNEQELNGKGYLCININDNIITSNFIDSDVRIFNFYGQFISSYKFINQINNSQLRSPRGITVDINTGNIFVADSIGRQIVILNDYGLHIKSLRTDDSNIISPIALSLDSTGKLFVLDGSDINVFILNEINEEPETNPQVKPRKKKKNRNIISLEKTLEQCEINPSLSEINMLEIISLSENDLSKKKYKTKKKKVPTATLR